MLYLRNRVFDVEHDDDDLTHDDGVRCSDVHREGLAGCLVAECQRSELLVVYWAHQSVPVAFLVEFGLLRAACVQNATGTSGAAHVFAVLSPQK